MMRQRWERRHGAAIVARVEAAEARWVVSLWQGRRRVAHVPFPVEQLDDAKGIADRMIRAQYPHVCTEPDREGWRHCEAPSG